MTTIVTRAGKGSPLTNAECDANFTNLNAGKLECSSNLSDLTNAASARTNLGLAIGTNVQAYSADLAAIAALGNGIPARTGSGTWAARTLAVIGLGLAITNGDGVAGAPQFALANDVAAIEALAGTGFAVRTAADTWTQRTIAGTANRISVTNGTGVSGDPTIDISASYVGQNTITTVGTIATGTWSAAISTTDANFALTNSTKTAKFSAAAISAGTTRTYTLPDVTDTLVSLTAAQTLTNKTISAPTMTNVSINGGAINNCLIGDVTPAGGEFTDFVANYIALPITAVGAGYISFNGLIAMHCYGGSNLFLGKSSGNFTLTGVSNVANGNTVLASLTSGSYNIGIGNLALTALTSANDNIGIGNNALKAQTIGNSNVAIGSNALTASLTGTFNVAIGTDTLTTGTAMQECVAIGYQACKVTTGGANVAVGSRALIANTAGSYNNALGYASLMSNVSGNRNTAIGDECLLLSTGSNNTALGATAGITLTTGDNNTLIGKDADVTSNAQTNSIAVGYQAKVVNNNEAVIGNSSLAQIRSMSSNGCDLGTSTFQFKTAYLATSLVLAATSGNVNGITLSSVTTTNAPTFDFTGTDANVTGKIRTKGTGSVLVQTNSASAVTQLEIQHTASATRYVQITGSNGGDPTIGTSGGNLILKATSASVAFGTAALATNATTGFLCVPTCAGAPTGVPASLPTGQIALVYDTTNHFLYFYDGGWKKSTVYA